MAATQENPLNRPRIARRGAVLAVLLTACSTGRLTEERPAGDCAGPVTPIHAVQGSGPASTLAGSRLAVRGVVVGDFQRADQLAGFFLQDARPDGDPRTSEGLFVDAAGGVAAGDLVQVSGRVEELAGLTALTDVGSIAVCRQGEVPAPAPVSLLETPDLEPYEGMLVLVSASSWWRRGGGPGRPPTAPRRGPAAPRRSCVWTTAAGSRIPRRPPTSTPPPPAASATW